MCLLRGKELNLRPLAYEANELPLLYPAWLQRLDSNQRPPGYEPGELTRLLYSAIYKIKMERVTGLEPVPPAWKAGMLAIKHHTRILAPPAGLEPATLRLTAECSTY